jgi:hypothetical protein
MTFFGQQILQTARSPNSSFGNPVVSTLANLPTSLGMLNQAQASRSRI